MQAIDLAPRGPNGGTSHGAEAIVAAFLETVNEAGADPLLCQRLGVAAVVVALDVRELPGRRIVVSLAPDAVWGRDAGTERADVEISLAARDIHDLMVGGLPLPMKIAADDVTYRGPVRRFLRVIGPLGRLGPAYTAALDGAPGQHEGAQL